MIPQLDRGAPYWRMPTRSLASTRVLIRWVIPLYAVGLFPLWVPGWVPPCSSSEDFEFELQADSMGKHLHGRGTACDILVAAQKTENLFVGLDLE